MKVEGSHSRLGVLHLPKRYRSAYIIDGQHRLYGYSDSIYASTNSIPVVAFVDLDRQEQIKLFMDINENQKAVPKTLRVTLNADMLWDSPDYNQRRQALRSKIAQMLGEEDTFKMRLLKSMAKTGKLKVSLGIFTKVQRGLPMKRTMTASRPAMFLQQFLFGIAFRLKIARKSSQSVVTGQNYSRTC